MKKDIHPEYHKVTLTCGCGNVIEVGTTEPNIKIETCSKCHPFYSGTEKTIQAGGRVDKFKQKYNM